MKSAMASRGSRDFERPPPPQEAPPPLPPGPPPPMFTFGAGEQSRPDEFSFRMDQGPAPQFAGQDGSSQGMFNGAVEQSPSSPHGRQPPRRRRGPDPNGYRNRPYRPFAPASRPLLSSRRARTPDQMSGMTEDQKREGRFILAEDVSDSDEQDMEMDSPESAKAVLIVGSEGRNGVEPEQSAQENGNEPPRKKRLFERGPESSTNEAPKPKWSNPDPYTALPPGDETQKKKKDVVKLIRKARKIDTRTKIATSAAATNDDFIALNFDDDTQNDHDPDSLDDLSDETRRVQSKAPSAPKSSRPRDRAEGYNGTSISDDNKPYQPIDVWPPPSIDDALGNRKRTYDDRIKDKREPPVRRGGPKGIDGEILSEWRVMPARPGVNPIPWSSIDHSQTANMGFW